MVDLYTIGHQLTAHLLQVRNDPFKVPSLPSGVASLGFTAYMKRVAHTNSTDPLEATLKQGQYESQPREAEEEEEEEGIAAFVERQLTHRSSSALDDDAKVSSS